MAADLVTVVNLTRGDVPLSRGKIVRRVPITIRQRELLDFPDLARNLGGAIRRGLVAATTAEGEHLTPDRVLALAEGIHAHTHDDMVGVDPLPASKIMQLQVACQATDAEGDLVGIFGAPVGGLYHVGRVDITNGNRMPAVGVLVQKTDITRGVMQTQGLVSGYAGLVPGRVAFAGANGRPTHAVPLVAGQRTYVQVIGVAFSSDVLEVMPSPNVTIRAAS